MSDKQKKPNRRTPDEKQETLNLVESILKRIEKFKITAYELNKVVAMTIPAIDSVIKGITKMPSLEILREIDSYIKEEYETEKVVAVNETPAKYGKDGELSEIMHLLKRIEDKIEKSDLKQEIIFEILKNAKAAELSYMEKTGEEKISSLKDSN